MAVKVASIEFDLVTNVAKYADDMGKAARATDQAATKIASSMKKAEQGFANFGKGAAAALAVGALTAGLVELSKNIDDQEKGLAQVQASLKSTGGVAGVTEKQVLALSDSIKKLTSVDDDAVTSMQSVLLTFTKVGKEVFPQATQAIVDMSAKLGGDLKTSALQVGKALNDPIKGLGILSKAGVSFTAGQKDMIKSLVETGHTLEAQKIIIKELNTEFGGSATAARNTFGGAMEALKVRVGDLYQSIGGTGGLRLGLETLIIVAEKTGKAIEQMGDPATKTGKQIANFSIVAGEAAKSIFVWANAGIMGFDILGKQAQGMLGIFKPGLDNVGKAFNFLTGGIQETDKALKSYYDKGLINNYFKGITDSIDDAKKRMSDMDAIAKKVKNTFATDESGVTESKGAAKARAKAASELAKERKTIDDLVRAYALKGQQVAEETKEQKQLNELIELQRKISNEINVPLKERLKAINQTATAYKNMIEAQKQTEIKKEGEGLTSILDDLKEQLKETKAKKTLEESMIPIWEAEKRIKEATKKYNGENLDLQKQILEVAKEQAEQIKADQHEDALKTLKEITEEYQKELDAANAKVTGQENLNKLLKDEKKIRDDIHLSEKEKDDAVSQIKAADAATKVANTTYEKQKKVIKDILSAKDSDAIKTQKLNKALKDGAINADEYKDAIDGLNGSTSKTASLASGIGGIFSSAFSSLINGGTKATDVLKNVGKEIATLAAKKLLLEPLEKMFSNWAKGVFAAPNGGAVGTGAQQPGLLQSLGKGLGLFPSAYGAVSQGAANAGGGFLSGLGGAVSGAGSWIAKMLGFQTGGSYADQGAIRVAENGPEMVWPGGYGSASPYLAGLNGPETYFTGGRGGYVSNAQDTLDMFGGYGGYGGYSSNQDVALGSIGEWRQRVQDASRSGRPLSYFEIQEGNAKAYDTYKRGLDWSSSDELDLARVMDAVKRAEANAYLENERNTGGGGVNFNWRTVRANEMSQDGLGFTRSVEAGGRAVFADGNQQRSLLEKAAALNIDVPTSLWNKAGLMADVWDQQDQISGGTAQSRNWYNLSGSYGGSGYKSMGLSGNNLNNSVTGADIWDTNSGANGAERMDAMGGKEFMWQKFHNFKGAGYENVKDMWSMFHSANLSYGGGNYVGDPTYGPRQFPGFSGTTSDRNKAARGLTDYYGDMDLSKHRPGRERAWVDQPKYGKYTLGGPIAVPTLSGPGTNPPNFEDWAIKMGYLPEKSGDYTKKAFDSIRGRSGETDSRDLTTRRTWTDGADVDPTPAEQDAAAADEKWMHDYGEKMNLGYSKKGLRAINADGRGINDYQGLKRNSTDFWKNQNAFRNTIPGLTALASGSDIAGMIGSGLNKITSYALDTVSGGAVGAPGHLSTSNDVFDQGIYGSSSVQAQRLTDSQRMNSPYRNFAEGFGDGIIGARTGAYIGATAPRGGWATKYSGGRASGGRVNAGRLYSVAERGDELFMPEKAGNVIPMHKLGSAMGGGKITINNNALPPHQVQVTDNGSDKIINLMRQTVAADLSGGALAKAMASRFGIRPKSAMSG